MIEADRNEMWSILREAFESIHRMLIRVVPGITMQSGHHHNDAFLFRAYAEYSASERVLVISFNIQATGKQFHAWGDIAREDGMILKDVMDVTVGQESDIGKRLGEIAKQFASDCRKETQLIENALK